MSTSEPATIGVVGSDEVARALSAAGVEVVTSPGDFSADATAVTNGLRTSKIDAIIVVDSGQVPVGSHAWLRTVAQKVPTAVLRSGEPSPTLPVQDAALELDASMSPPDVLRRLGVAVPEGTSASGVHSSSPELNAPTAPPTAGQDPVGSNPVGFSTSTGVDDDAIPRSVPVTADDSGLASHPYGARVSPLPGPNRDAGPSVSEPQPPARAEAATSENWWESANPQSQSPLSDVPLPSWASAAPAPDQAEPQQAAAPRRRDLREAEQEADDPLSRFSASAFVDGSAQTPRSAPSPVRAPETPSILAPSPVSAPSPDSAHPAPPFVQERPAQDAGHVQAAYHGEQAAQPPAAAQWAEAQPPGAAGQPPSWQESPHPAVWQQQPGHLPAEDPAQQGYQQQPAHPEAPQSSGYQPWTQSAPEPQPQEHQPAPAAQWGEAQPGPHQAPAQWTDPQATAQATPQWDAAPQVAAQATPQWGGEPQTQASAQWDDGKQAQPGPYQAPTQWGGQPQAQDWGRAHTTDDEELPAQTQQPPASPAQPRPHSSGYDEPHGQQTDYSAYYTQPPAQPQAWDGQAAPQQQQQQRAWPTDHTQPQAHTSEQTQRPSWQPLPKTEPQEQPRQAALQHQDAAAVMDALSNPAGPAGFDRPAPAPNTRPGQRSAKVVVAVSAKGGVGKSTLALALAERAAAAGPEGFKVVLVDANRHHGDLRFFLRLREGSVPTIYDAVVSGNPEQAIAKPDAVNAARGQGFGEVSYALVAAPPREAADPNTVTTAAYRGIIDYVSTLADLVVIDTQVAEPFDTTGMFPQVLVPLMAGGAHTLAVADMSTVGVSNLVDQLKAFAADGLSPERTLVVLNGATEDDERSLRTLTNYVSTVGTYVGAVPYDRSIRIDMNVGQTVGSKPSLTPVVDSVLRTVTGLPNFGATAGPGRGPAEKKKRGGLLGRSKK